LEKPASSAGFFIVAASGAGFLLPANTRQKPPARQFMPNGHRRNA
jgi:hypothetical protein